MIYPKQMSIEQIEQVFAVAILDEESLFPLSPYKERKRILAKLEETLSLCEKLKGGRIYECSRA